MYSLAFRGNDYVASTSDRHGDELWQRHDANLARGNRTKSVFIAISTECIIYTTTIPRIMAMPCAPNSRAIIKSSLLNPPKAYTGIERP